MDSQDETQEPISRADFYNAQLVQAKRIKELEKNKKLKFWDKFEPADLIAIILVMGVVIANLAQITQQFMVPQALLLIVGFYFGGKHYNRKEERK